MANLQQTDLSDGNQGSQGILVIRLRGCSVRWRGWLFGEAEAITVHLQEHLVSEVGHSSMCDDFAPPEAHNC